MKKMKKAVAVLLSLLLLLPTFAVAAVDLPDGKGDVTGDGVVDNKDVARLMRYFTDWIGDGELDTEAADLDGNGTVDARDLMALVNYLCDRTPEEPDGSDAPQMTMTVGTAETVLNYDNTVELAVTVENNPGLGCFVVQFDYDESKLEPVDIREENGMAVLNAEAAKIVFCSTYDPIPEDGTVLTAVFNVLPGAEPGEFLPVSVSCEPGFICDADERLIDCNFVPGGIKISEFDGSYDVMLAGSGDYDSAYAVFDLLNRHRRENGLSALVMDEALLATAMQRAAELAIYYSHTRPDNTDCFTAFPEKFGGYALAENIAAGYYSPEAVMEGWIDSPGHNANMLGDYSSVGIGCFVDSDGMVYWVQVFSDAEGSPEEVKSTGVKDGTWSVKAVKALLDLYIVLLDDGTDTGEATLALINLNQGWEYSLPNLYVTNVRSSNPEVASVWVDSDGLIKLVMNEPGDTFISVDLYSVYGEQVLTVETVITVYDMSVIGDVNGDGEITNADITRLMRYLAGLEGIESLNLPYADANLDGEISNADITRIMRMLAGLA